MDSIQNILPLIISVVCALLLIALVGTLILSQAFRNDVLGGEGEATVLGVLSVKGVAIVLLCGLFIGGLIYPLKFLDGNGSGVVTKSDKEKNSLIKNLELQIEKLNIEIRKFKTEIENKDRKIHDLEEQLSKITADTKKNKESLKNCIERNTIDSLTVKLSRDETKTVFGDLRVTLIRVGNINNNADFYYSYGNHGTQYKKSNLGINDYVTREFNGYLIIIKVIDGQNKPDRAILKLSRIKMK